MKTISRLLQPMTARRSLRSWSSTGAIAAACRRAILACGMLSSLGSAVAAGPIVAPLPEWIYFAQNWCPTEAVLAQLRPHYALTMSSCCIYKAVAADRNRRRQLPPSPPLPIGSRPRPISINANTTVRNWQLSGARLRKRLQLQSAKKPPRLRPHAKRWQHVSAKTFDSASPRLKCRRFVWRTGGHCVMKAGLNWPQPCKPRRYPMPRPTFSAEDSR